MTTHIDLQGRPEDEYRGPLFDAIDGTNTGDTIEIVADRDVDPHLVRYQLERDRILEWDYDHPDAEPRELQVTVGDPLGDGDLGAIDVRDLKPQRRHTVLLDIFDELGADEGFVLVNDHDPKPLYHELRSMYGDVVGWEYASQGSGEWRVEIVKTGLSEADADDGDVCTRYDVRDIPKQERHPTIHHRYGMIPAGETMEIVAPHEPNPLKQEFQQQYGDAFSWKVVDQEPGRCRVRITKTADSETESIDAPGDDVTVTTADGTAIDITDELDVRELPPAKRHELIFEAYDELMDGNGFILVNDHDPKPLYHQFDAEAGPEFRWEYRKRNPGEFRVLIGKSATTDATPTASEVPDAPF